MASGNLQSCQKALLQSEPSMSSLWGGCYFSSSAWSFNLHLAGPSCVSSANEKNLCIFLEYQKLNADIVPSWKNLTFYPHRQAQASVFVNPLIVKTQILQLITVKDLGKLFLKATENLVIGLWSLLLICYVILLPSIACDFNKCNHSSQDRPWLWGKAILLILVNWQHGIATNSVPGSHLPYHHLQTHKSEREGHKPGLTPVFPDPAPRNKMRLIPGCPELKISLHRHFKQTLSTGMEERSKLHDAPIEGRSIWCVIAICC